MESTTCNNANCHPLSRVCPACGVRLSIPLYTVVDCFSVSTPCHQHNHFKPYPYHGCMYACTHAVLSQAHLHVAHTLSFTHTHTHTHCSHAVSLSLTHTHTVMMHTCTVSLSLSHTPTPTLTVMMHACTSLSHTHTNTLTLTQP